MDEFEGIGSNRPEREEPLYDSDMDSDELAAPSLSYEGNLLRLAQEFEGSDEYLLIPQDELDLDIRVKALSLLRSLFPQDLEFEPIIDGVAQIKSSDDSPSWVLASARLKSGKFAVPLSPERVDEVSDQYSMAFRICNSEIGDDQIGAGEPFLSERLFRRYAFQVDQGRLCNPVGQTLLYVISSEAEDRSSKAFHTRLVVAQEASSLESAHWYLQKFLNGSKLAVSLKHNGTPLIDINGLYFKERFLKRCSEADSFVKDETIQTVVNHWLFEQPTSPMTSDQLDGFRRSFLSANLSRKYGGLDLTIVDGTVNEQGDAELLAICCSEENFVCVNASGSVLNTGGHKCGFVIRVSPGDKEDFNIGQPLLPGASFALALRDFIRKPNKSLLSSWFKQQMAECGYLNLDLTEVDASDDGIQIIYDGVGVDLDSSEPGDPYQEVDLLISDKNIGAFLVTISCSALSGALVPIAKVKAHFFDKEFSY